MTLRPGSFNVFIGMEDIFPENTHVAPPAPVSASIPLSEAAPILTSNITPEKASLKVKIKKLKKIKDSGLFLKPSLNRKKTIYTIKNWIKKPTLPTRPTLTYGGFMALLITTCVMHVGTIVEHYALRTVIGGGVMTLFSSVIPLHAQNDPEKKPETPEPAPPAPPLENAQPGESAKDSTNTPATNNDTPPENEGDKPSEKTAPPEPVFDMMGLTESQLQVLLSLNKRLKDLESREQSLVEKEKLLKAFEKEVMERQAQLKNLKNTIEEVAKNNNDDVMKNMNHMVAVYEAMKPDVASKIFNELPKPVLVALIKQMKPKKASAILSLMRVDIAKAITDHFAFSPYIPDEKTAPPKV